LISRACRAASLARSARQLAPPSAVTRVVLTLQGMGDGDAQRDPRRQRDLSTRVSRRARRSHPSRGLDDRRYRNGDEGLTPSTSIRRALCRERSRQQPTGPDPASALPRTQSPAADRPGRAQRRQRDRGESGRRSPRRTIASAHRHERDTLPPRVCSSIEAAAAGVTASGVKEQSSGRDQWPRSEDWTSRGTPASWSCRRSR
jgi:hypothetical protein